MGLLFFRYLRLIGQFLAVFALLACAPAGMAYGQVPMERVYATSQTNGGALLRTVTNPGNAVDANPSSYSTISIAILGDVWQRLQFPTDRPAGSTVRVKIGTTGNILGLLGNIQIQAFQNGTARGAAIPIGNLITLLAGEDQAEIVFTPTESYNSVRIRSSGVALGDGLKIYEAYYLAPASPGPISCDAVADLLYGSTGDIAGGLNAVSDAYEAIDGDPVTFATLRTNVSVGNRTHLTALYNTVSQADDSIRVALRSPASLLDVNALSSTLRIRTLLDNTDNGDLALDPQLLSLRLLAPGSDIQVLTYPVSTPFNRVEISLGDGLAEALASLHVHEIQRAIARPVVNAVDMEAGNVVVCENESTTLFVENPQADADYYWYATPTGGEPVATGPELAVEPAEAGTFTYYAAKARQGCLEESERTRVVVHALPQPQRPELSITDTQH